MAIPQDFVKTLLYPKRASELPEEDDSFGWMIGSWEMEAELHGTKGQMHKTKGEVHASWVLEGRAIQDLFIFPRRADRQSEHPARGRQVCDNDPNI